MIELREVCAGYPGKEILHGVSVTFPKGQVTGIIGPNGCGKTTLLKTAARLLKPLSGEVLLEGRPVSGFTPKEFARRVAVLPQSRAVPSITVASFVMHGRFPYLGFPRTPAKADWEKVDEALEQIGLAAYRHRSLSELSGGERQKVYLAMLLAQDAQVLLLDEPTTYLDINHQLELLSLVRKLNETGKTVVMVMHDLSQALRFSHEIILMQEGEIAAQGPAGDVYESGKINEVFHVRSQRMQSEEQIHYLFY